MPPSDICGLAPNHLRRETLEKKMDTSVTNRLTCIQWQLYFSLFNSMKLKSVYSLIVILNL